MTCNILHIRKYLLVKNYDQPFVTKLRKELNSFVLRPTFIRTLKRQANFKICWIMLRISFTKLKHLTFPAEWMNGTDDSESIILEVWKQRWNNDEIKGSVWRHQGGHKPQHLHGRLCLRARASSNVLYPVILVCVTYFDKTVIYFQKQPYSACIWCLISKLW